MMRSLTLTMAMLVPLPAFSADPIQPPANVFAAEPARPGALWWRQIRHLEAAPRPLGETEPIGPGSSAHAKSSFGIWWPSFDYSCIDLGLAFPDVFYGDAWSVFTGIPLTGSTKKESTYLLVSGEWKYTPLFDGWLLKMDLRSVIFNSEFRLNIIWWD